MIFIFIKKFFFLYYYRERIIRDTELQVEYEIMKLRWQQINSLIHNDENRLNSLDLG
jgi:hypothetical protein